MVDVGASLTEGINLQPYVEKAKSASGEQLVSIVQEALSDPNVFVFQELLDLPNVREVCVGKYFVC